MSILIIPGKFKAERWINIMQQLDSSLRIHVWPNVPDPIAIEFAIVWRYPHGELLKYPRLKAISSLGAGVDHIFSDPQRPRHVPVVRIVDKWLTRDMTQFIVLAVLNHIRHFEAYTKDQTHCIWHPRPLEHNHTIGIMGLGELGLDAAEKLHDLGLHVMGWSTSPKNISGIKTFTQTQFHEFLSSVDIVVCLLPLTPQTYCILNRETFQHMRRGTYIINVARGGHVNDQDLIEALNSDQLSGACLDVFDQEPLPADHPFWRHPKIKLTPHIASITNPHSASEQLVENYHRLLAGKPLLNQVDNDRGY